MITANNALLTDILTQFLTVYRLGFGYIQNDAFTLLGTVGSIDLILAALFWAMKGEDFTAGFIKKILIAGLFLYFVQNWQTLTDTTVSGFVYIGAKAGGGSNVPALVDPSSIIKYSETITDPINQEIDALSANSTFGITVDILDLEACKLLILLACCFIAITAFLCYLEFYIVAVLSLIMLPFGIFKPTAFLAEKAIGSIISFGVRLMVLAFVLSTSMPLLQQFGLPVDPTFHQCMCILIGTAAIAFLAYRAPAIASGMMSGSPSLTVGDAIVAGAAGVAAAKGGYNLAKSGVSAAKDGYAMTMAAANVASGGLDKIKAAGAVRSARKYEAANLGISKESQ